MAITSINLSSLNGSNGFRLDGVAEGDFSGWSVSNAGDINDDGFDDVIVGAPGAGLGGNGYVVFGKASGFDATLDLSSLDGSNGFRLDGIAEDDFSGDSVSNAGDVNGDGFDDVIIGAPSADASGDRSGSSYVIFGKASGFAAAMDLSSLDGTNGFRLDGVGEYDQSGRAVSGAGDINGDGFDDVIIGAVGINSSSPNSGDVYVVFGKPGFDAVMDLSTLDNSNGFRFPDSYSRTNSVSSAGDINGDGYNDLIFGQVFPSPYHLDLDGMASYVMFGKASGFDSKAGFRLSSSFGFYDDQPPIASSAGDVNGDGFDDLIIGVRSVGSYTGSSFVVFGKADDFVGNIDLSSLDGTDGFRVDGVAGLDYLGESVSGAGDVNGDGYDDLIIGAAGVDPYDIADAGASYLIFGKASGFAASIDLSNLDVTAGIRLDGVGGHHQSGGSVSGAGDINADGFDDLIIGARFADPNGRSSGASYVLFGSSSFTGTGTFLGTSGDDMLTGTAAAERFLADDGNDIMIGGGGADFLDGEAGDDIIRVPDVEFQIVNGGTGNDTLELTGSGVTLNLANFYGIPRFDFDDTIKSIETIDLTGNGDNTLAVTEQGLVELSETTNTLIVKGNAGDYVTGLSQGWSDGGIQDNFHAYVRHGATLLIDTAVSTDPLNSNVTDLSNLNGSNGFRIDGVAEQDLSGWAVSNAGDINGDSFDDVIIGARSADPNGGSSGSSYLIFGKASGFAATMELSSLDSKNGFRLDGVGENEYSGHIVNDAGDINGDGFDDVIIAARHSSFVVFGKASSFGAAMNLSKLDGNNGFRINNLGESVSSAGDINGDGFDDVIVGGGFGSSYVILGKAAAFDPAMDISTLNGINGFRLDGAGTSVSKAGDVNGDGFDDVMIGASEEDSNGERSGSTYVVFGKETGFSATMDLSSLDGNNGFRLDGTEYDYSGTLVSSAGDINGDGFADLIIGGRGSAPSYVVFGKAFGFTAKFDLASLDGSNGFSLVNTYDSRNNGFSVSNAGDVNGDGYNDLIMGSNFYYSDNSSSSHIMFGKASGFDPTLDLTSLNGSNGARLDGKNSIIALSGAGDVNGDGFADVLGGAPFADPNGIFSGSSYVIFGSRDFGGGQLPTIPGTSDDDVLRGTSAAEIFEADDGNDILIGNGGADVFHGGAGVDQIKVPDLNFDSIDGGAGNDILHLAGAGLNLDLTTSGDNIQGIETICLYGRGDNTLTLTADSVLDLSDTSNTLKLHGNAGDRVTVQDDGWVDGGVKGFYHTYTNDDAVLLVGANLTIEFV